MAQIWGNRSKDPEDVLDYTLDWSEQMVQDGDTIASYTPTVVEGTCEISSALGKTPSFDDDTTIVWIEGGEAGETCIINNHIVTAAGREYDHRRKIKIKEQ